MTMDSGPTSGPIGARPMTNGPLMAIPTMPQTAGGPNAGPATTQLPMSTPTSQNGMVNGTGTPTAAQGPLPGAPRVNGMQTQCHGCKKRISDKYLLKALDVFWHEDCLKCGCCDCRLGEVGASLYTKADLILCKRDYLRLFGNTGNCAACHKMIPAFEMVMRARSNVYHLECFACQQCNHRFCVGDRFFLWENKILCEYDYEERMMFSNMSYDSNNKNQRQAAEGIPDDKRGVNDEGWAHHHGQDPNLMRHGHPGNPYEAGHTNSHHSSMNPHHQRGPESMDTQCGSGPNNGVPPSSAGHSDDASSGYGSPDSVCLETR